MFTLLSLVFLVDGRVSLDMVIDLSIPNFRLSKK